MEHEYLDGKEHDAYVDDISGVMNGLISNVLDVADKHNVDRDNAMQHFSQLLSGIVSISTFQHYKKGSGK